MKTTELAKLKKLNHYVAEQINKRIETFFSEKIIAAKRVDPLYAKLMEDIKHYLLQGGKRLRPTLMVIGYQAARGKNANLVLDAGLALEVFHSFLLIHDDVMDGDTKRHNRANIAGVYERRYKKLNDIGLIKKQAESMAILAGELNEAFTFEIIASLKLTAEKRLQLMQHLQQILLETAGGQQLDVLLSGMDKLKPGLVEKVNYYKTARYSVVSPLVLGQILADSELNLRDDFENYGREVGLAFQLVDDLLGIFGSTKQTGKPVGSDIREGKQTMLIMQAKKLATPLQWKAISTRMGKKDLSNEDINLVRQILKECGAQNKVMVQISDHIEKALKVVDKMKTDEETKQLMVAFALYCAERKK